ncbi:hypothetical protein BH10CHL1_BH10CHL1_00640 [soil metagenome]
MQEAITERYGLALRSAALEAFGGHYEARRLAELVDAEQIKAEALQLILDAQ